MLEILVVAFILGLLGDVVTGGRVSAVLRGTTAGVARTGYRAAAGGISTGLDATRTGRGTKATARGVAGAVRDEFARLPGNVRDGRGDAERSRQDAQDPAAGARPGWLGRTFDRPPALVIHVTRDGNVNVTAPPPGAPTTPAASAPGATPTNGATPVTTAAATPNQPRGNRPYESGRHPDRAAGKSPHPGAGSSVRVESLPGFTSAVANLAAVALEISEQATANLHLNPEAQAGLTDAIDTLNNVAKTAHSTFNPLTEAADATPQGAEGVTVGQAKSE